MGNTAGIALTIVVTLGMGAITSAKDTPAQKQQEVQAAAVDTLAQSIFASADRNHNQVLNKSEFQQAQELLDAEIAKLGQQGAIGQPKKQSAQDIEKAENASASAEISANKLSRSNKVTRAEFTYYVHSVVDEADQYWRQMRAQAAAQQKAFNAQRQRYGRTGRTINPGPYQYPPY